MKQKNVLGLLDINGRLRFAPTRNCTHIFKNVINLFVCIKLFIFLTISFPYLIYSLGGYIRNKIQIRKSNFKKVGAIPSESI